MSSHILASGFETALEYSVFGMQNKWVRTVLMKVCDLRSVKPQEKWFCNHKGRMTLHSAEKFLCFLFIWLTSLHHTLPTVYSIVWFGGKKGCAYLICAELSSGTWIMICLPSVQPETTCGFCVHFNGPGECWTQKVYPYCVICSCWYHDPGLICQPEPGSLLLTSLELIYRC